MDKTIKIRIDDELKKKVMFVVKCKGSDLSKEVRKMCEKYAVEYEELQKNNR